MADGPTRTAICIEQGGPERVSRAAVIRGPFGRPRPRFAISVIDLVTEQVLLRYPVDGSEHEARALASLMRDDLERLGDELFLKSSRWVPTRRRRRDRPW
jgi:hypothetical protein